MELRGLEKPCEIALGLVMARNRHNLHQQFVNRARCAFDQSDTDSANSVIRIMVDVMQLCSHEFDSQLCISFFEYVFNSFEKCHSIEITKLTADLISRVFGQYFFVETLFLLWVFTKFF